MSLFLGPMRQHIPGKKELTEKSELLHLMPKKEVYIPLVAGRTLDFDILVQEGDTVSVGTKLAETKSGFMCQFIQVFLELTKELLNVCTILCVHKITW